MKVIWTQTALESFEEITDYIFERFTAKEVNDFIDKSEERINLIVQNESPKSSKPPQNGIYVFISYI